jgi:hypothetical protein
MIERPDPNKLCLGDNFYRVERNCNNSFTRKKEYRIIDGEEWYKYLKPRYDYELVIYTVIGILEKKLIGDWDSSENYELLTQFYLKNNLNENFTTDVDWFSSYNDELFLDKDAAMTYISQKYAEDREKDRS